MPVAKKIEESIKRSSWIREMFEAGARLKAEIGPDKVFDFSLGNPDLEPPARFNQVIKELVEDPTPGRHAYMSNSGWPEVRAAVAAYISGEYGVGFSADDIVMTTGAGGALNVVLKTILDQGDEVLVSRPYFVEYNFYVDNHGGVIKLVDSNPDFSLNLDNVAAGLTPRTRAVLINSPNNPTGAVYSEDQIRGLSELLARHSAQVGRPVILVSDEPYRKIVYDGATVPSVFAHYANVIGLTSYSKDLSLPGERIGFLAVHPDIPNKGNLVAGLILANRILGFVNAPSLMQRVVARLQGVTVDTGVYRRRRDLFVEILRAAGLDLTVPRGAFYLFPRTPIADDVAFVRELQKENILAVPGTGFGGPGHIRLTYCVSEKVIEGSREGFARAVSRVG
ncbi:MAG: pyridoxal phosphate-dependent aminotransferase [Pseudomonadota bacterium]